MFSVGKTKPMSWLLLIVAFTSFLFFHFPEKAEAARFRTGNNVKIDSDKPLRDDLYISGGNIEVNDTINGDLIIFGGSIIVNGDVKGDLILLGGQIDINGLVDGTARIAGGDIFIKGTIKKDLMIASGNLTLNEKSRIGRDIVLGVGRSRISGSVGRRIIGGSSDMVIDGSVNGDVVVTTNELKIGRGAVIDGDLKYTSENKASISSSADIGGEVHSRRPPVGRRTVNRQVAGVLNFLVSIVWLMVLGTVMLALFPSYAYRVNENLEDFPWKSLIWGILALILTPIIAGLLVITIIGFPLALILFFIYLFGIYISKIYFGHFLGKRILGRIRGTGSHWFWSLLLGIMIILILAKIPILGPIIRVVVVIFGLGAIVFSLYQMFSESRTENI